MATRSVKAETSLPAFWDRLLNEAIAREGIRKAELIREGVILRLVLGQVAAPNGKRVLDELDERLKEAGRYE